MSGFGAAERTLARGLSRFPRLKALAKDVWTTANYALHREAGMREALAPGVRMVQRLGGEWDGDARFVGYYEPTPFDADGARLAHHRWRSGAGQVDVLVLEADGSEQTIGCTPAFSPQQGARLHWVHEGGQHDRQSLVYNDVEGGRLGSRWVSSRRGRWFHPWPVAALAPDGRAYASLDFAALSAVAPDYGYAQVPVSCGADRGDDAGVRIVDAQTADARLRLSCARARACAPSADMAGAAHELNHVQFSPDGARVIAIHRWQGPSGRFSRLLELELASDRLTLRLPGPMVSHCAFLADGRLVAWARLGAREGYFVMGDGEAPTPLLAGRADLLGDGHPSPARRGPRMVCDSYPDRRRQQHLYLVDVEQGALLPLARFLAPLRFRGSGRVDLHPRLSPCGTRVCVDSAHSGVRGCYVLDISEALERFGEELAP